MQYTIIITLIIIIPTVKIVSSFDFDDISLKICVPTILQK